MIQSQVVASNRGFVYNYMDLVCSHMELTNVDIRLARFKSHTHTTDHTEESEVEISKLAVIKRFLDEVEDDYDFIFIDCPPNLHPVTLNAIFSNDFYLIPAMPDHLSSVGITHILQKVATHYGVSFTTKTTKDALLNLILTQIETQRGHSRIRSYQVEHPKL